MIFLRSPIFILPLTLALTIGSYGPFMRSHEAASSRVKFDEVLYLPSGKGLELISFGYQNVLADVLWFNTVSYFGKHFAGDGKYEWLNHMCNLVPRLNPSLPHVYEFCSTMLSWEANSPELSNSILTKGIQSDPNNWRFYYLRGFNHMYFMQDSANAQKDFAHAAKLDGAPQAFLAKLAAKQLLDMSDPRTAAKFLEEMIQGAQDPSQIEALRKRLFETRHTAIIADLKKAYGLYKERSGKALQDINELVAAGVVSKIPADPWGGKYYYDPETDEFKSTSNKKVLNSVKSPNRPQRQA